MVMYLVWDKGPSTGNSRNSEGSFIRIPDGRILFAYSRYNTEDRHMRLAYGRGNAEDRSCLGRLGIQRIPLSAI